MYVIEKIEISKLRQHPRNEEIYGKDDITDLKERITVTGRIEPIKITKDGVILSGHRRVKAAIELGYTTIDCIVMVLDPVQELEFLLDENCYRNKTIVQKIREGMVYYEIESKKSEQRKIDSGKRNLGLPVVEKDTTTDNADNNEKGKTRDIVGKKVKISGKTFEKGVKIIDRIDNESNPEIKAFLTEQTNRSVDSTYKLIDKPTDFISKVKQRFDSTGMSVGKISQQITIEERIVTPSIYPDNLIQILYVVVKLTKANLKRLFDIPISKITDDNSFVYVWVKPSVLDEVIKVMNSWGYSFLVCDSWERKDCEYRDPFTGTGVQMFCVFTKGTVNIDNLKSIFYRLKKNQIDPY